MDAICSSRSPKSFRAPSQGFSLGLPTPHLLSLAQDVLLLLMMTQHYPEALGCSCGAGAAAVTFPLQSSQWSDTSSSRTPLEQLPGAE